MRRLLLLVLLLVLLPAAPASASDAAPASASDAAPVVVVGVPGLRWDDVGPATPTLQRLVREGASGLLSVKAVPAVSCPADGWLTLGAGNRAVAAGVRREPCGADLPDGLVPSLQANAEEREGAELGALREALERAGECVGAQGPGAELAVASNRDDCVVELREAPPVAGTGTERVARAVAADRAVAQVAPAAATLLVVGLSEAPGDDTARLHVALAHGPAFEPGALRSASTRRAPYVQLVDVAPTVLDLVGVEPPASMTGQPWRSVGEPPTPAALADLALLAEQHKRVTVPFFVVLLTGELLLAAALWRRRPELAEAVVLGGVAAPGASYVANLLPWWRSPVPLLTLLAVVLLLSAAVVAVICRAWPATRRARRPGAEGRRTRAAGAVCAFTAGVVVLDLLTGAHLQMSSVGGYSPLVAGRFAGVGNVAFGVLAAGALLAAAVARRWVLVLGALVVAVDGAPMWGSDVGGVLALVPAFVLLALLLSGRRVSVLRLALAGLVGAAVVTAFAIADWSRAEQDRTHLGRFVQDVVDGTAGTLLRRKAVAVLELLLAGPLTALLPVVVAAAVYLLVRPPRPLARALAAAPHWRAGLLATGLASAVGFAVNDSGAAVPAMALTVAVPATLAVVLRARREPDKPPSLLA